MKFEIILINILFLESMKKNKYLVIIDLIINRKLIFLEITFEEFIKIL